MRNEETTSRPTTSFVLAWLLLLCVTSLSPLYAAETTKAALAKQTAPLETGKLRVVIADNEAFAPTHLAGYNGVAELRLADASQPNLFVPEYAGLNLAHIFSGDVASYGWHIFEPRQAPMELREISNGRVELRQERTEHWPLRSRLVFEVKDDAIDLTYYRKFTQVEDIVRLYESWSGEKVRRPSD